MRDSNGKKGKETRAGKDSSVGTTADVYSEGQNTENGLECGVPRDNFAAFVSGTCDRLPKMDCSTLPCLYSAPN